MESAQWMSPEVYTEQKYRRWKYKETVHGQREDEKRIKLGEHTNSLKIRCKFENCAATAVYGHDSEPVFW